MTAAGFHEFEFDLTDALLARLSKILESLPPAPLDLGHVEAIPNEQGVYALLQGPAVVYIGKTGGETGLRTRLGQHWKRIQHRQNIDPSEISFRAVRVFVFTPVNLEKGLIAFFRETIGLPWNGSGFGNHDPGRERDTTKLKDGAFDKLFPIDIDRPLSISLADNADARSVLVALRLAAPYSVRFDSKPELKAAVVQTPLGTTTRAVLQQVFSALPSGWQATKLGGRVILYKENKAYPHGEIIART